MAYICLSEASGSWVFPLAIWVFPIWVFPLATAISQSRLHTCGSVFPTLQSAVYLAVASGQPVLAEASGQSHLEIASGQSVGQSLSPSVPIAVSASISVTICPLPFPLRHALLVSRSTQSFRLLISVRPPYIPPSLYISACDVAVSSAVFLMASSTITNTASAYATAWP